MNMDIPSLVLPRWRLRGICKDMFTFLCWLSECYLHHDLLFPVFRVVIFFLVLCLAYECTSDTQKKEKMPFRCIVFHSTIIYMLGDCAPVWPSVVVIVLCFRHPHKQTHTALIDSEWWPAKSFAKEFPITRIVRLTALLRVGSMSALSTRDGKPPMRLARSQARSYNWLR